MFGERHQSCLLFIELRPILRKALDECFQDVFSVALILAADNGSSSAGELPPDALTDPNVNL
jgi:hypothetical protein